MNTILDKDLLLKFDPIRDEDEKISWVEQPKFLPFILAKSENFLFPTVGGAIWVYFAFKGTNEDGENVGSFIWIVGAIILAQGVFAFSKRLFSYSNTAYAYSDRRIMIRTGFISADFITIDYDKILEMQVNVNLIEKIYHVGTVKFFNGKTESDEGYVSKVYEYWHGISNPHHIFKLVKQNTRTTQV